MRTKKETNENPVEKVAKTLSPFEQQDNGSENNLMNPESNVSGAYEIAPGMTVEEMKSLFFDENTLVEPGYKLYQLNSKGHRYYYRYTENGEPEFYPSVTTILSQTMATSPFLINWIASKGVEEAERYKAERAAYGTFMHAAFEELLIKRTYDLDNLKDSLKDYIEANKLPDNFIFYADDLKKDVLAFAQFVRDYDVKPLAIEIALVHPVYKYAGMLDLPCNMLEKPGSKTRINAIVDFKSGRKGFHEDHEIQLHLYKDMWNANFEDCPIDRVFNFSPKDWRKKPTYNLKDQTDSPNAKKIPALLELASIEDAKQDNVFTSVGGKIYLDNESDLNENITSLTLSELVKKKNRSENKNPEPKESVIVEDLKQETKLIKKMTSREFEVEINDVAPYSLWDVNDIAKRNGVELVERGINLDEHRWYSIATNIYKCSDGFVKVTGAYQSFSESQTWEDINVFAEAEKLNGKELKAFELRMKAYEIENEPEQNSKPEKIKTEKAKTTKRSTRKKTNDAKKNESTEKKTIKRVSAKVPKEQEKQKDPKISDIKKDLLNDSIEF